MNNDSANILNIKNIQVTYDDVILALHDVSLKVPKGKVVALLGANGAGKSTTLKAVSTMLASERGKVTKGSINYDGTSIDKQNPSQMVGLGMVQVLEGRRCFGHLTVEENIISGAYSRKLSKGDINQELEKMIKENKKNQNTKLLKELSNSTSTLNAALDAISNQNKMLVKEIKQKNESITFP